MIKGKAKSKFNNKKNIEYSIYDFCNHFDKHIKTPGLYFVYSYKKHNIDKKDVRIPDNLDSSVYYSDKFLKNKIGLYDDKNSKILYIGQSTDLNHRLKQLYKMIVNAKGSRKGGIVLSYLNKSMCKLKVRIFIYKTKETNSRKISNKLVELETKELIIFADNHGFLPFANFSISKKKYKTK